MSMPYSEETMNRIGRALAGGHLASTGADRANDPSYENEGVSKPFPGGPIPRIHGGLGISPADTPVQHNHFTRIIKRFGQCPSCDAYHYSRAKARVLITGSRDWWDDIQIGAQLARAFGELGPFVLVHGGARGADTIAADMHEKRGFITEMHLANWALNGKRAGFVRNAEMVSLGADLCLAFIKDESRGATMCANLAEKAGIPTRRFTA